MTTFPNPVPDTGYVLLGLVLERAAGKPLAELYDEYVFDPLGMTSSTYPAGVGGVAEQAFRETKTDNIPKRTTERNLWLPIIEEGEMLKDSSNFTDIKRKVYCLKKIEVTFSLYMLYKKSIHFLWWILW